MNTEQMKAAGSLIRALKKVRDADLNLFVYDGEVFVCPKGVDVFEGDDNDALDKLQALGFNCSLVGLHADGGAGV